MHDVTLCICTPCCSGTFFPLLCFGHFFVFMFEKLMYEGLELLSRFLYVGGSDFLREFLLCLDRFVVWVSKNSSGITKKVVTQLWSAARAFKPRVLED